MRTNLVLSWLFCRRWSFFFLCTGSLLALPHFELLRSMSFSWPAALTVLLFESVHLLLLCYTDTCLCVLSVICHWQHPAFALGSSSVTLLLGTTSCLALDWPVMQWQSCMQLSLLARVWHEDLQNCFIALHHVPSLNCPSQGQWKTDFT